MVLFRIFVCSFQAVLVDIDDSLHIRTEHSRRNGQNTRAGAHIEQLVTRLYRILERHHAQLGRVVATGAEGRRRVDLKNTAALRVLNRLPRGLDHKAASHRERLEILLPAPLPVLLTGQRGFGTQSAPGVLLIACLEVFQRGTDIRVLLCTLVAVRQIDLQTGFLRALLAHEILVYIVPVYFGVLEKFFKIRRILEHIAFYAVVLEQCLDRTDALGRRVDRNFSPVHRFHPAFPIQITALRAVFNNNLLA